MMESEVNHKSVTKEHSDFCKSVGFRENELISIECYVSYNLAASNAGYVRIINLVIFMTEWKIF